MNRRLMTSMVLCASAWSATPGQAQERKAAAWPAKAVRVVVPYAAGGTADILGRVVATHLQVVYKQPFVVENRAGGAGTIGSAQVAKSPPDGQTLVVSGIGSHVIAPVDIKAFNPLSDFTHIAIFGGPPTVLVVNPSIPPKTLAEFIAYAQNLPAGLSWGSPGKGTHGDLIGELFARRANYRQTPVGYRGANPAVADLLGGQIQAAVVTYRTAAAHIKGGRLRALAITSPTRLPDMPALPTFAELGYPELTASTWFSLSGPAGMPPALVSNINEEVRRSLKTPAAQKLLMEEGIEFLDWDAPAFNRYLRAEIDRWVPLVKSLNNTGAR